MGKKRVLTKATPEASKLLGKWLGVPTSFFGVEVEGARYLARCTEPHAKPHARSWSTQHSPSAPAEPGLSRT